jgi:hypothetical protein
VPSRSGENAGSLAKVLDGEATRYRPRCRRSETLSLRCSGRAFWDTPRRRFGEAALVPSTRVSGGRAGLARRDGGATKEILCGFASLEYQAYAVGISERGNVGEGIALDSDGIGKLARLEAADFCRASQ